MIDLNINKLKDLLKWAASSKHSGTLGAAGLLIYVTYILWSFEIVNEPTGIVYVAAALTGFGLVAILNHISEDDREK